MIPISADIVGADQVVLHLEAIPERVRSALKKAMLVAMVDLRGYVSKNKLSGQVLKVRTGTLRRSITQRVSDSPTSVTGIVGTNIVYAAIHEYGFQGTVTVRDHLRALKSGARVNVSSHSRTVNMPERSFLRSSLKEKETEIRQTLADAIKEAVNGSQS